jgi:hypothetical protein
MLHLSMATSISNSNQFEQLAFVWNSVFASERSQIYVREDQLGVVIGSETRGLRKAVIVANFLDKLSKADIVERFLNYTCGGDAERYLYRNLQISKFLSGADMNHLRAGPSPTTHSVPLVLMEDRNRDGPTRYGTRRPLKGPLAVQEFYEELCTEVICPLSIFASLTFNLLSRGSLPPLLDMM